MTDQRHKYTYEVKPDSAPSFVIEMVGTGKRVLELGPGPGSITRHLKLRECRVTALEIDLNAIELAAPFCERIICCDLNTSRWPDLLADSAQFPVIVAADVLEHLYDPWLVLELAKDLLSADGCFIISLPHIAHSAVIGCLLNEDFAYQDWGLLDRTHIRFWGLKNIQRLFNDAGLKIIEVNFVVRQPEQTEFADFWKKLPSKTKSVLQEHPFGNVYQVVIRAVPNSAEGVALDLCKVFVPPSVKNISGDTSKIRLFLRKMGGHLSPDLQRLVVRMLRRIRLWPRSGS